MKRFPPPQIVTVILLRQFSTVLFITALLLSGCGGGGSSGNTGQTLQSRETLVHDGLNREYILYIPATYDGATEVPLLFNFHGFSLTMEQHLANADMRAQAEAHNFILVYPQGTGSLPVWNAARTSIGADDTGFIETLISKLLLEYKIDSKRIYAVGYSNGAMLSYALACYSNGLIAAVGAVSGTQLDISAACTPAQPTATINIHGTSDILLPYHGNAVYNSVDTVLGFWRNFNNTSTTPVYNTVNDRGTPIEHYQYTQGTNNVAVEHYKVVGGGHSWFNLNYQGNNTGDLLWNFVSKYDSNAHELNSPRKHRSLRLLQ